jgi:hypothetical protein
MFYVSKSLDLTSTTMFLFFYFLYNQQQYKSNLFDLNLNKIILCMFSKKWFLYVRCGPAVIESLFIN